MTNRELERNARAILSLSDEARPDRSNEFLHEHLDHFKSLAWALTKQVRGATRDHKETLSVVLESAWEILTKPDTDELETYTFESCVFTHAKGRLLDERRRRNASGIGGAYSQHRRHTYLMERERELTEKLGRSPTKNETLAYARSCLEESGRDWRRQGMNLSLKDFEKVSAASYDASETGAPEALGGSVVDDTTTIFAKQTITQAYERSLMRGIFAEALLTEPVGTLTPAQWGKKLGLSLVETADQTKWLREMIG